MKLNVTKYFTPSEVIHKANEAGMFAGLLNKPTKKFLEWLPQNHHVFQAFYKTAYELKRRGRREYYSAYCIREKLRWDSLVSEVGTEYKLSNDFTPHLARLIMALDSKLKGMFKLKSSVGSPDEF